MINWQGKNIIVVGAARQGLAATRFFAKQGAKITLTDMQPENLFADIKKQFSSMPVKFSFGSHPLDLLDNADVVCLSGGVPLSIPLVIEAEKRQLHITNDSQIFMDSVKARVIGITGSAGKTTTTILAGAIAKAACEPKIKVWMGGNIGYPLLDDLKEIKPDDLVVLELSSFQLEQMTVSPHVAVVLNITPNHLDRHKTMNAYIEAKARILAFQSKDAIAILNRDDNGSINLKNRVRGRLVTFGFSQADSTQSSVYFENGDILWLDGKNRKNLISSDLLQLTGNHNLANAMAACAVGASLGFSTDAMKAGIESVKGVPHRLELVKEKDGIRWFNDSIATAPERVMAAIKAINPPFVLLLGGRDKDLPWEDLARVLRSVKPKLILFGEAANLIHYALINFEGSDPAYPIWKVDSMEQAVKKAAEVAENGEAVLLSPGGTSFDAYRDFEERGEEFRAMVEALT